MKAAVFLLVLALIVTPLVMAFPILASNRFRRAVLESDIAYVATHFDSEKLAVSMADGISNFRGPTEMPVQEVFPRLFAATAGRAIARSLLSPQVFVRNIAGTTNELWTQSWKARWLSPDAFQAERFIFTRSGLTWKLSGVVRDEERPMPMPTF